jgi:V/A-type H+-transporting ATPase subunit D
MAEKILMNKNTLAALKAELREYHIALPVFEMKEQQLKEVVQRIEDNITRLKEEIRKTNESTRPWVSVMAEEKVELKSLVEVEEEIITKSEIAGVSIETLEEVKFEEREIDLLLTPLWVDAAVVVLKDQKSNLSMIDVEQRNLDALIEELAEARRMKNALKEVFIPETMNNIRKIQIYLGDVERLATGCAKLVKKKKQAKPATL